LAGDVDGVRAVLKQIFLLSEPKSLWFSVVDHFRLITKGEIHAKLLLREMKQRLNFDLGILRSVVK
jgi:hypothetical protein